MSRKLLALAAMLGVWVPGMWAQEPIKHRFLLMDESRHSFHYIDEEKPDTNWTVKHKGGGWDMQLLDANRLAVNTRTGWVIYDLKTRNIADEFTHKDLSGIMSMCWTPDGTKFLMGGGNGITVYKLDNANQLVARKSYAMLNVPRYIRLTDDGTAILAEQTGLTEVSQKDLEIVKRVKLPRGTKAFQGGKSANGNYLMGGGYGAAFFEITPDGKVVKEFFAKDLPEGLRNEFYSGFQVLSNGDVVCANWTGHQPDASKYGYQLMQFDPEGKLVWYWHDPKQAGTALQAIILDEPR